MCQCALCQQERNTRQKRSVVIGKRAGGGQTAKSVSDVTNVQWHIAVDVEQSWPSESIG